MFVLRLASWPEVEELYVNTLSVSMKLFRIRIKSDDYAGRHVGLKIGGGLLLVLVLFVFLILSVLAMVWPQRWLSLYTSFSFWRFMLLIVFLAVYLLTRE